MPAERITDIEQPPRLTLWDIETDWLVLIQARAEAEELPEPKERELAIMACDCAIQEYTERELAKVDGIRAVVRTLKSAMEAAKQERDYQAKRAASCEGMIARIKDFVKTAMEAVGKKRIDGRTGYLAIKGNGGLEPLVTDLSMLPPEYVDVTLKMSLSNWQALLSHVSGIEGDAELLSTAPSNARIRAALVADCPRCEGTQEVIDENAPNLSGEQPTMECPSCGGTGKAAVPGCSLGERGSHVEIR